VPNCDFGCYRFKSCYLPLLELKKINIPTTAHINNIYCAELKKLVNKNIICPITFYKNIAMALNTEQNDNVSNINKTLIIINSDKAIMIIEVARLKKNKLNFFDKNKFLNFWIFYENYTSIFIASAASNLTNFKLSYNLENTCISNDYKKTIHFNLNLVKSQVFLAINNKFNKILLWNLSLGVLLKKTNFGKNARRTKFGFDFLLKFLKKKINLLLNLNYFIAITIRGHKKIISNFITWFTRLIPSSKIAFLIWLPKVPRKGQRKKKYSAIKKNLKKRLLKIK
jgi:hypothetical protein